MKKSILTPGIFRSIGMMLVAGALFSCTHKQANVTLDFNDDFNGNTVDLINFNDSTLIACTEIADNKAVFNLTESDSLQMPVLAMIMVDGRVKGYYVVEDGEATWTQGQNVAEGTEMNATFKSLMSELDEADEAEDFDALIAISEKNYNANKDNIFGPYFGVEWLKWANPLKVDSLLAEAPASLRDSKRAQHYINFARLRAKTAPGQPYVDFEGADADGKPVKLSEYMLPKHTTLVDFMASWCPYCIKDMPKIKEIYVNNKDKGLEIVSVAVRDEHDATARAVEKHGIDWKVIYDAQRRPYDIYGFSGIPHYMLVGPDGTILVRSSNLADIESALSSN